MTRLLAWYYIVIDVVTILAVKLSLKLHPPRKDEFRPYLSEQDNSYILRHKPKNRPSS